MSATSEIEIPDRYFFTCHVSLRELPLYQKAAENSGFSIVVAPTKPRERFIHLRENWGPYDFFMDPIILKEGSLVICVAGPGSVGYSPFWASLDEIKAEATAQKSTSI